MNSISAYRKGERLFFLQNLRPALEPIQPLSYFYRGFFFPLLKRTADETTYSPSSAEVKNEWSNTFASSYALIDLTC